MDRNERVGRVEEMERAMDAVIAAADELEHALARWEETAALRRELIAYYDGGLWREDYEADEAGELPAGLKRGVLSEDGLYELLDRADELERALAHPAEE